MLNIMDSGSIKVKTYVCNLYLTFIVYLLLVNPT